MKANFTYTLFVSVFVRAQFHHLEMEKFCLLLRVLDFNVDLSWSSSRFEDVFFELFDVAKINKTSIILFLLILQSILHKYWCKALLSIYMTLIERLTRLKQVDWAIFQVVEVTGVSYVISVWSEHLI